jgi:hypothetical protein
VVWADLDNDADLDLYITRHEEADLVLLNDGNGGFDRVMVGWAEAEGPSNGLCCGDLDGDGDLDLYIARGGASNVLMRNDFANANGNHWLHLDLRGSVYNLGAIGARVTLTAGGATQVREVTAGSGYLAQNALRVAFGLGSATSVDLLEIAWPGGETQVVPVNAIDRVLAITEGEDPVTAVGDGTPSLRTALGKAFPNPFNPQTTIAFSLARAGHAQLAVYTVDGHRVATLVSEDLAAGEHQVSWNGRDNGGRPVASGAYFYRLTTDSFTDVGRMVLVK